MSFSNPLRRFFTVLAIQGMGQRVRFMEKAEALSFVESDLPRLASFKSSPPVYTGFGFSPKSFNLSASDVGDLLRAFGINDGWRKLGWICREAGSAPLNLEDDFKNLIRTRNRSAHDSTTNVPASDLDSHLETVALVGIAIDVAITHAVDCYVKATTFKRAAAAADKFGIKFRFLDHDASGTWRERSSASSRTLKLHADLKAAFVSPTRPPGGYVVRDTRLIPMRLL